MLPTSVNVRRGRPDPNGFLCFEALHGNRKYENSYARNTVDMRDLVGIGTPLKNTVFIAILLLSVEACRAPIQSNHPRAPPSGVVRASGTESQDDREQLREIVKTIYLGQLYPSGNVYLRSFREDSSKKESFWPSRVRLTSLLSKSPDAAMFHDASFFEVLADETGSEGGTSVMQTRYIPGFEHMDAEHEGCDVGSKGTKNSKFVYEMVDGVPDEFFDAISDHCESNEGVAVYKVKPNQHTSYSVIASSAGFDVRSIERIPGHKRPLAEGEKSVVEQAKAEINKEECNTEPVSFDDATVIFSARIGGTSSSIRISHYDTPGCAGHLASVYILDVLSGMNVLGTYELIQYRGAL